jgi:hypothetical protein
MLFSVRLILTIGGASKANRKSGPVASNKKYITGTLSIQTLYNNDSKYSKLVQVGALKVKWFMVMKVHQL